jgi:hypothetical protein
MTLTTYIRIVAAVCIAMFLVTMAPNLVLNAFAQLRATGDDIFPALAMR